MNLPRSLHLVFLLILLLRVSRCENSGETKSAPAVEPSDKELDTNVETNLEGQDSFMKKQGLAADVPDQIAVETSHHEQVEQLPGYPKYPPIPVPVPIKGYSESVVLPLPPQQKVQQNVFQHGGIQGQYSQPQQIRKKPPPSFGFASEKLPRSKEEQLLIAAPSHQQYSSIEQHRFNPQHQQHQQQQQHDGGFQQHLLKNPRPNIFQQYQQPQQQQQQHGPPKLPQFGGPQESLTQSIIKEFLSKAHGKAPPPPPHHPHHHRFPGLGPAPPGFGGPLPNKQNVLHHGGKPFQASKDVSNELQAEGGEYPSVQYGPQGLLGPAPAAAAGAWPEGPETQDMAKIVTLDVKCEKNVMRVFVAFDRPFYGVIFSKGHYHSLSCIHLPAGLGHTSANFDIGIDSCGTLGNSETALQGGYAGGNSGTGSYFENIIVIQYDAQVQEVWDQARKLRCTWHDQYEKSVTFRPFPVDQLDVVRADFAGDNVGCWMQIQVGKGPWASEVSGLVKIGQTMTMVLAIKDDENKFDMLVRNCLAHDGQRSPIQLVDQFGCIARPKLMSKFTKIKNFGASASVLSYAHFQAFKFPDSMEVHFQCTIQICRYQCPEQCSQSSADGGYAGGVGKSGLPAPGDKEEVHGDSTSGQRRRRRSPQQINDTLSINDDDDIIEYTTTFKISPLASDEKENVGLNRVITVVSNDDLEFLSQNSKDETDSTPVIEAAINDVVCMSTFGFASMLVVLIGCLLIACVVSAVLILVKPKKY